MPARDPAVPPALGTSPQDARSTSVLPTHTHPGQLGVTGRKRSSSSAFSRFADPHHQTHPSAHYNSSLAATHAPGPSAGTNAARRVSTPDALVSKLFRRISFDHGDDTHHHHHHHRNSSADAHAPSHGADDGASESSQFEEETLGTSHTSRAIRESTNRLASMSFSGQSLLANYGASEPVTAGARRASFQSTGGIDLGGTRSSALAASASSHSGPSGLSKLMERGRRRRDGGEGEDSSGDSGETTPHAQARSLEAEGGSADSSAIGAGGAAPAKLAPPSTAKTTAPLATSPTTSTRSRDAGQPRRPSHSSYFHDRTTHLAGVAEVDEEDMGDSSELRRYLARGEPPSERTPLLATDRKPSWKTRTAVDLQAARNRLSKVTAGDLLKACVEEPVKAMPAVILGLLLNVLDGVSYGMILFPATSYYPDYGSLGVSMFFVSCIVAQLTFTLGGSIFKAGNGSMMIEAVPFFHIICSLIQKELDGDSNAIVATTMAAFAFSSIVTGLVFFALGYFRLGALIGYFPRHILVGCIGGVGVFLLVTGLQVSLGLSEGNFEYDLKTLKLFFKDAHNILLWTVPFGLAVLLRVITHFFHHQLIFPAYFLIIPAVFYTLVAIFGWDWQWLRDQGWVFDVGQNVQPWYTFYTKFDFRHVNWSVFWSALPSQLALVFFGILHVPLNVPALGVSLAEDNVSLDQELIAHGVSNVGSGLFGSVPNYLCYVNTVLFYRVGGDSRLAGLMLAGATFAVMCIGPTAIGFLPITMVAALIFVLGIDLVVESLWDTRNRVNRMEYITIWVIAIGMTVFDFVIGLFIGIILACVFFVIQSSRRRPIRAVLSGSTAKSTVRRPRAQREFIQRVGEQTCVMKLQGFLFFGTIGVVEDEIRSLVDMAEWEHNPIRFLIIDFALVAGLDFSSAEAFVRIQRILAGKDVLLILCGADPHGLVGTALRAVDLWADQEGTRVEVFASLNDALEWTENAYLTAFYENQIQRIKGDEPPPARSIDLPKIQRMPFTLAESFQNSPRRTLLARAGDDTLPSAYQPTSPDPSSSADASASAVETSPSRRRGAQPLTILRQTMGPYAGMPEPEAFFAQFTPYFTREVMQDGGVLWRQGDESDGLYLIESGSLRATYEYNNNDQVQETMVAGTVAGDLSALSDTLRNATVVAERETVLWKLSPDSLAKMEKDLPEAAAMFVKIVLKAAVEEVDVVTSHLIAVLS